MPVVTPCQHRWHYTGVTLDSAPPLYLHRCEICSDIRRDPRLVINELHPPVSDDRHHRVEK